ncbi:Tgt2/MlaC family protein [Coxiella endosymbiont of Dermacentor marginatus]|uniref:Tgt2/MlaC family protein n=1 Tax=Coxiella endosymbiont of Dermacentor marginatus TaxID=1656159 RepID=UPI003873526F
MSGKFLISYNLVNDRGQWKIYDFSIEGVSLIQSYHSQFSEVLAQKGLVILLELDYP